MGHQSLIYGAIEVPSAPREKALAAFENNRHVLNGLPTKDEWPFLVQGMFSLSQSSEVSIEYGSAVIHFGASYKDLEEDWAEWLRKFEGLLFRLQGIAAVVHLESERFGNHKLQWVAKPIAGTGAAGKWEFICGPRTSHELGAA